MNFKEIIKGKKENGLRVLDYEVRSRKKSLAEIILEVELERKKDLWVARGVGPVEAVFKLLRDKLNYDGAILSSFSPVVRGEGVKAQLQVMCSIEYKNKTYWGRSISEDVTKSPVDAVIDVFSNMHFLLSK